MSRADKITLIIRKTAWAFELDPRLMTVEGRGPHYVARARQVAMWLIRSLLDVTHTECAAAVRRGHHSTVTYAINQVEGYRAVYADFKALTDRLYTELKDEFSEHDERSVLLLPR